MTTTDTISWDKLRSDIYIRDKGICWICNVFVQLTDYDLGHLIDRVNGGHDAYDNLAVMHMKCNHSKPFHNTLEETVKWKLTQSIPIAQQTKHHHHTSSLSPSTLARRKEHYDELIKRITLTTLCWKQGSPQGGPMWRILPPPYQQKDMFTLRITPPGARDIEGSIRETLQIIGGQPSTPIDTTIYIGHMAMRISFHNSQLSVTFSQGKLSNTGERSQTVGMGEGQIPIGIWHNAKAQGLSLPELRDKIPIPH